MDRHTKLGIVAAALMAAPIPALAQTWPSLAVTTAGQSAMAQPSRAAGAPLSLTLDAPAWRAPAPVIAAWSAPTQATPTLTLPAAEPAAPLPDVKVPAKAAWTDDQGVRFHYTEITYKQRF